MENLQPEEVALEISKNAAVEKAKGDFLKEQDKAQRYCMGKCSSLPSTRAYIH
jgi:hypothetical protein